MVMSDILFKRVSKLLKGYHLSVNKNCLSVIYKATMVQSTK